MNKKFLIVASAMAALLTVRFAAAEIIFCADCQAPYKRGGWKALQQITPGRITLVPDPSGLRGRVMKVEVRPGDDVGGWGGERAEKTNMMGRLGAQVTVPGKVAHEYYGLSIRLAPDWTPPDSSLKGTWGSVFQLHGPDAYKAPPALALMVEDRFHLNMYSGDITSTPKKVITYELSNGSIRPGKWVDFILDIAWSPNTDGWLALYRRDEGQTGWTQVFYRGGIPTLQYIVGQPLQEHYWKAGFYRNPSKSTSVLWLGPIVRATTRAEVEAAAFR